MYRALPVLLLILLVAASPPHVIAADLADPDWPWERFGFTLGGFVTTVNSQVRIGDQRLGAGIDIDIEEALGLNTTSTVFRLGATYRFGKSRRHQAEFSWFELHRDAAKTLESDIVVDDVVYPVGTMVDSYLDFQIWKAAYNYSFFLDDRINLAAGIGLFVVPIKYGVNASGIGETGEDITAPLPVVGLRAEFVLTRKWFLRASTDLFYLEIGDFRGTIVDSVTAVEYKPWKHLGFGLAANFFKVGIEAKGGDFPNIDFVGNVQVDYLGLLLYGKLYY